MSIQKITEQLTNLTIEYGLKLAVAILFWIIGVQIIRYLSKKVQSVLEKRETDTSLKIFSKSLINLLLKSLLVISILATLGVKMTSFIAILGAIGLAIGMALSGTLQNFAGGIVIITFRPFKIGDLIQAQGHLGIVKEIQIFNTILNTTDNKTVIIPNGGLSNSSMTNFSTESTRRVDWIFGIGYGDDIDLAEKIIKNLCAEDTRIFKDPEPFVVISELADNSVNFTVRTWVKSEDYWAVFFDMNKSIYKAFDKEGINIPFPQMDLHLHKNI
ncbi:mechanosensitive ion channel [Tenacibaculum finnmarkense genomovar finnmarkense]|uniref:mechanosensitive ion channel family protein n=1 Tax=Tenacibaculum finnmarkense TaxID=2781243 RepID=UPI001EFAD5A2|nr:mechanosensitive ion channel domain-containing protein [Tenacibaculum finnmarkense]MCG8220937.1 mechanosensitive ion channel [Tenacibaculum finnmarkense genomovar finnmarkense]MCG8223670.1 mechanosensitive ion channel [Tenacibaculum finnmarkense genomovar finnmarkense]MCG8229135.1 mechanosensitive ion channel [Tenacibaculum finnmarkense genomovar finnmarkense]